MLRFSVSYRFVGRQAIFWYYVNEEIHDVSYCAFYVRR